jgi:hypothetical protein
MAARGTEIRRELERKPRLKVIDDERQWWRQAGSHRQQANEDPCRSQGSEDPQHRFSGRSGDLARLGCRPTPIDFA